MPHSTIGFTHTTRRVLTRRGVVWLGQTCNLRCRFCYFQTRIEAKNHPDHPFMALDKAKAICTSLRQYYGNEAVDIQGGEPTIYPGIHDLVRHCAAIGLKPTLITNALALARKDACTRLHDAGVRDLLVSVHGMGETYDFLAGVQGAHKLQMQALDHLGGLGIPMRFNCVLAKSVLPHLTAVARLACALGVRALNFIAFNPFEDQMHKSRSEQDVPTYSEVAIPLQEALDILIAEGIEANVRYYPLCMLPAGYRNHLYNFQQLPYDLHEWDYASWSWTAEHGQRRRDTPLSDPAALREYNLRTKYLAAMPGYADDTPLTLEQEYRYNAMLRARKHCGYTYDINCDQCSIKAICDGFHGDYASFFGAGEARPVTLDAPVDDPTHYIREQRKIVENDDAHWAA